MAIICNNIAPLYGRLKMVSTLNNGKFKVQFISEDNIAKLKTPIKRWDNFQEMGLAIGYIKSEDALPYSQRIGYVFNACQSHQRLDYVAGVWSDECHMCWTKK